MSKLIVIAVRAILWRRWASLGLLLIGVFAFAAAGVAPLWSNAAEDSLIARSVTRADAADRVVVLESEANSSNVSTERIPALALVEVRRAAQMPARLDHAFGPAQVSLSTQGREAVVFDGSRVLAPLLWRNGGCAHLILRAGRCPAVDTDVVISRRTATNLGASVGDIVTLPGLGREPVVAGSGKPFPIQFDVVGIYRPSGTASGFWAGSDAFAFTPASTTSGSLAPARTEAVFTTGSLLTRLGSTGLWAEARRTLTLTGPRADQVDQLEQDLSAWAARLQSSVGVVVLDAPALRTIVGLGSERDAVRLSSYLLGLQLLALAWYVLFLIVANAGDARSNDLVLAKLRGLRTRKVAALALAEPLIVVSAAAPLGLLLAGLLTFGAASVFLADVHLRPDLHLLVGTLVALAGAGAATALGLRRVIREPLLDQLQRAGPSSRASRLAVVEVVIVTLAGAALYEVGSDAGPGRLSGLALLAPGLAALAVAVLAGRLLRVAGGLWARLTRQGPSVAGFLAARQLARRTGGTRVAVLATVAVSLATFAGGTWEIAERQRAGQAAMEVGAPVVYRVAAPSAAALLTAVRDADPSGKQWAAAVQLPAEGAGSPGLAIDAARLAAVAGWQPDWSHESVEDLARELLPKTASSLTVVGANLRLAVDAALSSASPDVALVATLVTADGRGTTAGFGRVRFGAQVLEADADECARGCRITGMTLVRRHGQIGGLIGRVSFARLEVDGRPITNAFRRAAMWRPARLDADRPTSSVVSTVERVPVGVRMAFNTSPGQDAGMVRADVPEALPVLATGATRLETVGRNDLVFAPTLDGDSVPAVVTSRVEVLPRIGHAGTLVDLTLVSRVRPNIAPDVSYQVWASREARDEERLAALLKPAGIRLLGRESMDGRQEALGRSGPALALLLLLGVAVAGLSLATFAVLASALVQGRRRAFEFAALRTTGVSDHALRQSWQQEYAAQLGTGVVFGLFCGAVTAGVAGPAVGVLGLIGPLAPARNGIPWESVLVITVGCAGLFAPAIWICARIGLWFSRPELLRAGPT